MIAIVTDSTACLTKKTAQELNIRVVPMSYTISGRTYLETYSDRNIEFDRIPSHKEGIVSTSQAPVSSFISAFKELVGKGYNVICIVISSKLSGTCSTAQAAAREFGSDKIIVIDSLSTAGGLSLLVTQACLLANKGYKFNEIALEIEKLKYKTGIAFSVESMDALRKSGRLGKVRPTVGAILNIRPILMVEKGGVVPVGLAKGKKERIEKLVSRVPKDAGRIVVHYLSEVTDMEPLYFAIKQRFPDAELSISRLCPSLGVHLGRSVIGVSWMQ